jgi:hypothetical protein
VFGFIPEDDEHLSFLWVVRHVDGVDFLLVFLVEDVLGGEVGILLGNL